MANQDVKNRTNVGARDGMERDYWTLWLVVDEEGDGWMVNGARRVGAQIVSLIIDGTESHDRASPWNSGGTTNVIFILYTRDDQNNNTVTWAYLCTMNVFLVTTTWRMLAKLPTRESET